MIKPPTEYTSMEEILAIPETHWGDLAILNNQGVKELYMYTNKWTSFNELHPPKPLEVQLEEAKKDAEYWRKRYFQLRGYVPNFVDID